MSWMRKAKLGPEGRKWGVNGTLKMCENGYMGAGRGAPTCRFRSSVIRWIWIFFLPIFSGDPHRSSTASLGGGGGECERNPLLKRSHEKCTGEGAMKNQRKANETELGAQFMAPSGESSGAEPSETCRDRGRGETHAHRSGVAPPSLPISGNPPSMPSLPSTRDTTTSFAFFLLLNEAASSW